MKRGSGGILIFLCSGLLLGFVLMLRYFDPPAAHAPAAERGSLSTAYSGSGAEGGELHSISAESAGAYEALQVVEEAAGQVNESSLGGLKRARLAAGLTEEALLAVQNSQQGRYMYDMMDPKLHTLYAEIYMILCGHLEDILVSADDADELRTAFLCVFQDHPELYWMDGYAYRRYGLGKESYISFSGKYIYSAAECEAFTERIEDYVRRCFAGISSNADDYEKVRYIYEYVIRSTDYRIGARDNQNILSVFLYGESVCQGYAKAVQYLLNRLDIPCTMVVGKVKGGEGHAWNLVSVEDAYYYLDATWGDAGYLAESGVDVSSRGEVNYNYLNVTTEEISLSHTADNVVPLPYCVATVDNYYVREDRYFDHYDLPALKELFDEADYAGSRYVSFKCAGAAVYEEFVGALLSDKGIFELLPADASAVDYTVDEDQRVLSFWF